MHDECDFSKLHNSSMEGKKNIAFTVPFLLSTTNKIALPRAEIADSTYILTLSLGDA